MFSNKKVNKQNRLARCVTVLSVSFTNILNKIALILSPCKGVTHVLQANWVALFDHSQSLGDWRLSYMSPFHKQQHSRPKILRKSTEWIHTIIMVCDFSSPVSWKLKLSLVPWRNKFWTPFFFLNNLLFDRLY